MTAEQGANVKISKEHAWSTTFPDQPGYYLFYGDFVPPTCTPRRPHLHVCRCVRTREGTTCIVGNVFLYRSECYGVFKPLYEEEPRLEDYGVPGRSDGQLSDTEE